MFCPKCGKEIDDDADVCIKCGSITPNSKLKEPQAQKTFEENKTGVGILLGFLGLIGLIICFALYPSGTVARETSIKAWLVTFLIVYLSGIVIALLVNASIYY